MKKLDRLSDIGEREFVKSVREKLGIVDDDVYVDPELGLMLKVDGFRLDFTAGGADLYDMGWKAAISSVSDVISRGGLPLEALVSVGLPKGLTVHEANELMSGIEDATKYYNIKLVGGDTNEGNWIDVFLVAKPICYKPPDKVSSNVDLILAEPIGYTEIIFNSLGFKAGDDIFASKLRHPTPRKEVLQALQTECERITYSTDISDGLFVTLENVSRRLSLKVDVTGLGLSEESLMLIKELLGTRQPTGNMIDIIAKGGEDYVTLFVVPSDHSRYVINRLAELGLNPLKIGDGSPGSGVYYNGVRVERRGWDSFRGWD
jgi:thiamine-monophosphate kinase